MRDRIISVALIVLFAFALVGGFVSHRQTLQLSEKRMRQEAVQGCLEVSSYTSTDTDAGVTTTSPMQEVYRQCLQEKGY